MNNNTYPKILFPYDFSSESDYALNYLKEIADVFKYSVCVLNILDPGTKAYMQTHKLNQVELEKRIVELSKTFETKTGIPSSHLIKNVPIKKIRNISEKEDAEFIFLALTEPQKMASLIMKVVTSSPVPAYVVQHGADYKPVKNIMFPLDDSVTSRQKASWALRFAKKNNSTIHIFSINPATLGDRDKQQKQYTVINTVEAFFAKNNVSFVSEISKSGYKDFDTEIMNYAEKNDIDMYVIMIPKKMFKSISQIDFKLIFNPKKIPILCVNHRDLLVSGGFN